MWTGVIELAVRETQDVEYFFRDHHEHERRMPFEEPLLAVTCHVVHEEVVKQFYASNGFRFGLCWVEWLPSVVARWIQKRIDKRQWTIKRLSIKSWRWSREEYPLGL